MKIKRGILEDGIRKSRLTIEKFAYKVGVNRSTIQRAKRGCSVSMYTVNGIASVIGIPLEDLVRGEEACHTCAYWDQLNGVCFCESSYCNGSYTDGDFRCERWEATT